MPAKASTYYRCPGSSVFSRLAWAKDGASAIEFALVLRCLLLLLAGSVDVGHGLTVSRKLEQIAATSSDVVAQQATWTTSGINGFLAGITFILQPYSTSDLSVVVAVEDMSGQGAATVNWSAGYNSPALSPGTASPIPVPADIQEPGVQIVLTQVTYKFRTPLSSLLASFTGNDGYQFKRYFFSRPRAWDKITNG